MEIGRYNAKDCSIIVNSMHITGLGEDMISWSKDEAYFETVVGAQGDIVKSEINNTLHTLKITVQPTCPQLGNLLELQGTQETFPVWVINKALGLKVGGSMASVMEAPEISLGSSAEDMEFTFCVFDGTTSTNTEA